MSVVLGMADELLQDVLVIGRTLIHDRIPTAIGAGGMDDAHGAVHDMPTPPRNPSAP